MSRLHNYEQVDGRAAAKLILDGDDAEDRGCMRGQVAGKNRCRQIAALPPRSP